MRKCEKRNMAGHFFRRKSQSYHTEYNDIVTLASRTGAVQFSEHAYAHVFSPSLSTFRAILFCPLLCLSHYLVFQSFRQPATASPSDPPSPSLPLYPPPPSFSVSRGPATCACALSRKPSSLSPSVVHTNSDLSRSVANRIEEMAEKRFRLWR